MSAKSMRKIIEDLCEIKEAGSECRPEYNAHSSLSAKSMRKIIEDLCEVNEAGSECRPEYSICFGSKVHCAQLYERDL